MIACSSSTFEQEQNQINVVITQYDSLFQAVENIDISSVSPNLKRYKQILEDSKTKLSTDKKPSLKTMTLLNDMKLMKRQFKRATGQKKEFVTNIIRNQEQLQNLLNDIDNSIFSKEELNSIIVREQQAYKGISIEIYEFQSAYISYELRFDSLYQISKTFNYQ